MRLLDQLPNPLTPDEVDRMMQSSASDLAARKLLFDAERPGAASQPTPAAKRPAAITGWLHFARPSYGAEISNPEIELREALEGYRQAFEAEDINGLARYYAQFTAVQRAALQRYFDNAERLRVEFSDVQIAMIGDRAAVSFNRQDHFVDHQSGESQQVVVRVTKLFARGAEGWQIVPEE